MKYNSCRKQALFLMTKLGGLMIIKFKVFFLHGTSNSCSILVACVVSRSFAVKNKTNVDGDHVLIIDVTIDDTVYIFINKYNPNTEIGQIFFLKKR